MLLLVPRSILSCPLQGGQQGLPPVQPKLALVDQRLVRRSWYLARDDCLPPLPSTYWPLRRLQPQHSLWKRRERTTRSQVAQDTAGQRGHPHRARAHQLQGLRVMLWRDPALSVARPAVQKCLQRLKKRVVDMTIEVLMLLDGWITRISTQLCHKGSPCFSLPSPQYKCLQRLKRRIAADNWAAHAFRRELTFVESKHCLLKQLNRTPARIF